MLRKPRQGFSQDLRTFVVAVVAASVVAGPAAAAAVYVANADKVDNKHAVGSGAAVSARKGKLVATNPRTGRLPNNIIARAPNANKVDGRDATQLQVLTASQTNEAWLYLSDTPLTYVIVTIDAPGAGTVVLNGTATVLLWHSSGSSSDATVTASNTASQGDIHGAGRISLPSSTPTGPHRLSLPVHAVYDVSAAGTRTFRMVALGTTNAMMDSGRLTATYIPD
jgi:hypothetical protein